MMFCKQNEQFRYLKLRKLTKNEFYDTKRGIPCQYFINILCMISVDNLQKYRDVM